MNRERQLHSADLHVQGLQLQLWQKQLLSCSFNASWGVTFVVEIVLPLGDEVHFLLRTYLPWHVLCLTGCSCCDINITCIRHCLRRPFCLLRYKEANKCQIKRIDNHYHFCTSPSPLFLWLSRAPDTFRNKEVLCHIIFLWFGWISQSNLTRLIHFFASVFQCLNWNILPVTYAMFSMYLTHAAHLRTTFTSTLTPWVSGETNSKQGETGRQGENTWGYFWRLRALPENPVTQVDRVALDFHPVNTSLSSVFPYLTPWDLPRRTLWFQAQSSANWANLM